MMNAMEKSVSEALATVTSDARVFGHWLETTVDHFVQNRPHYLLAALPLVADVTKLLLPADLLDAEAGERPEEPTDSTTGVSDKPAGTPRPEMPLIQKLAVASLVLGSISYAGYFTQWKWGADLYEMKNEIAKRVLDRATASDYLSRAADYSKWIEKIGYLTAGALALTCGVDIGAVVLSIQNWAKWQRKNLGKHKPDLGSLVMMITPVLCGIGVLAIRGSMLRWSLQGIGITPYTYMHHP